MIIDLAVYEAGRRREGELVLDHAYDICRDDPAKFIWIGMYEPTEEEFDSVRREFGLHELAVEDAIKAHQRPKLEVYGESLFLVLKTARYVDPKEIIEFGEIFIFIGPGFIITVRHGEATALHDVRLTLESRQDLLRCGPGAVLHAIVDRVVDDYQPVIDGVDHDIIEVEDQVFSRTARENATEISERIYRLKREVLEFHSATSPLLDPLAHLARGHYALVHDEVREYFRDVHDHQLRIVTQVDGFRDLLTGALEANLTQISVRQNEDVRKISAWVAIVAVPTMMAGIYGMNFEHMPELEWELGYPAALAVMLVTCVAIHRAFKRAGWL